MIFPPELSMCVGLTLKTVWDVPLKGKNAELLVLDVRLVTRGENAYRAVVTA
jgi:hypothetical protein